MRKTRILRPLYSEEFSCIGSACGDHCCGSWAISVDEATAARWHSLADGPLRTLIQSSLQPGPNGSTVMRLLPDGACPLLTPERLCRIHQELGREYLCQTCAVYPRTTYTVDRLEETSLSLSCWEAARLVLLKPNLFPPAGSPGYQMEWDDMTENDRSLRSYFWPLREFSIGLIQNRRFALWQRMFLLGLFLRRVQSLASGELDRRFAELLTEFSRAIETGGLTNAMESIRPEPALQLEIILRVLVWRVDRGWLTPEIRRTLGLFTDGVGHTREASMESQAARYSEACASHFAPFFRRNPHILENYLINTIFREQFPFECKLHDRTIPPQPENAFANLAVQFALIKALLIGVAGARGSAFCAEDALGTIQQACKQFEHDPGFLPEARSILAARRLDNARGITMLLRN